MRQLSPKSILRGVAPLGVGLALVCPALSQSESVAPAQTTPTQNVPGTEQNGNTQGMPSPERTAPGAPSTRALSENDALPAAPVPNSTPTLAAYQRTLPAGVTLTPPTGTTPRLSITEAVERALLHNLSVEVAVANEKRINGFKSTVLNNLTPTLTFNAVSSANEINLAALGFKPQSLGNSLASLGLNASNFPTIVKVNVTSAQINLNQQLFNLPAYYLYKASRGASSVSHFNTQHTRGSALFNAGQQYLRILADASEIANIRSQLVTDQLALDQARARQDAGVGVHLDTLRAQVELQDEQQSLTSAEVSYDKDKIQLNRLMGVAADQRFEYTDVAPFADLGDLSMSDLLARAYTTRNDLLSLEAQRDVLIKTEHAARYDRLPVLAVDGYYGVLGETTGLYHGVFNAQGQLSFPIFEEAQFRGQREVARSQLRTVANQIDSLRGTIAQQLRDATLDIATNRELVRVAHSNVELSRQELADSDERFKAGVDDTLPVVQAQGSLAAAQTRLVEATFQFNVAKLQLSYYLGGLEKDFRSLLGPQPASSSQP